jgi:hypothetical protein
MLQISQPGNYAEDLQKRLLEAELKLHQIRDAVQLGKPTFAYIVVSNIRAILDMPA